MTVSFDEGRARLTGHCGVEEAEPLLEWLQGQPQGVVEVADCAHLHTALFQVLWAWGPPLEGEPADAFLRKRILPLLGPARQGDE